MLANVSENNNFCATKGTHNNPHIEGGLKVSATNATKKPVGAHAITGGLYIGGGPGEAGQLEAAEYPANVNGHRLNLFTSSVTLLEGTNVSLTCTGADYNGGELTAPAGSLTLSAASGCKFKGAEVKVSTNSCRYVYSGFEYVEDELYKSAAKITCNEGDAITIPLQNCTLKIPAQTFGGGETVFGGMGDLSIDHEAGLCGGFDRDRRQIHHGGGGLCSDRPQSRQLRKRQQRVRHVAPGGFPRLIADRQGSTRH